MASYDGYGAVPVDFSALGQLPQIYQKAQQERSLADLGKALASDKLDYKQLAGLAAEGGKTDLALSFIKLGQDQANQADFNSKYPGAVGAEGTLPTRTPAPGPAPVTLATLGAPQSRPPMGGMAPEEGAPAGIPDRPWTPRTSYSQNDTIVSAVPQGPGPNEGVNIAPNFNQRFAGLDPNQVPQAPQPTPPPQAAPSQPEPPQAEQPQQTAQLQPSATPQQRQAPIPGAPTQRDNPASQRMQQLMFLMAHPGGTKDQKKGIELALQKELDNSKLTDTEKGYVRYQAQTLASGQQPLPFFDYEKQLKTAGATMINTAEGMDSAQTKARIEIDKKAAEDVGKRVTAGRAAIPLLNEVFRLADKTPGGWAGMASPTLARAISGLGIAVPDNISNAELLSSISRQLIPSVRDPGSTSNLEQQMYSAAVPGLSQSQEGRVKIASMFKSQVERNAQILAVYRRYVGSPDLDQKLSDLDNKPVFSSEDHKVLKAAAASSQQQSNAGQPVRVNTPAEARSLQPGTRFINPDGQEFTR